MSVDTERKICYYELLGVPSDVDEDGIKRAYRRAALVWHPDKNMHRLDEATEKFKDIQNAYAVLSDPTERSWYDLHKEEILSGGDGTGGGMRELVNLMKYFSASAYDGFDDSENGFYTVYRKLFVAIWEEERQNSDPSSPLPQSSAPGFGTSKASYADIMNFYDFWGTYTSRMHFAWADKYNPSEGETRWARRAMEKENESERKSAKRERTDEIRALVQFIRRRDKRILIHQAEARRRAEEAAEKKKQEEIELKKRQKELHLKAKERMAAEFAAREEEIIRSGAFRLDDLDENNNRKKRDGKRQVVHRSGIEEEEEEEEEVLHVLECLFCSKEFRSAAALENHERSKKHLDAKAAWIKKYGVPEEALDQSDESEEEDEFADAESNISESDAEATSESEEVDGSSDEKDHKRNNMNEKVVMSEFDELELDSDASDSDEEDVLQTPTLASLLGRNKKKKKKKGGLGLSPFASPDIDLSPGSVATPVAASVEPVEQKSGRKPTKTELRRLAKAAAKAESQAQKPQKSGTAGGAEDAGQEKIVTAEIEGEVKVETGKAKRKEDKERKQDENVFPCAVCAENFPTRNSLFKHINSTGHAAIKSDIDAGVEAGAATAFDELRGKKGKGKKQRK